MNNIIFSNLIICNICKKPLEIIFSKGETFLFCKKCKKSVSKFNDVFDFENDVFLDNKNKVYDLIWSDLKKNNIQTNNYSIEKDLIIKNKKLFNNKIIIDAGVGDGRHLEIFAEVNPKMIICIDLSDGIYLAKDRWNKLKSEIPIIFIKSSIEKIKFQPESIDLIWCTGVLTIASNYQKLIKSFCTYSKNAIILGILNDNFFGLFYYFLNPLRSFFRYLKNKNLLNLILFPLALIIYIIKLFKSLFYNFLNSKDFKSLEKFDLKKIIALIQEPFISPLVNKINKRRLIKLMFKKNFKFTFLGKELFISYLLFEKT